MNHCLRAINFAQETGRSKVGEFKGFHRGSRFVIPNHGLSTVKRHDGPWFRGVDVHGLNAIGCVLVFLT